MLAGIFVLAAWAAIAPPMDLPHSPVPREAVAQTNHGELAQNNCCCYPNGKYKASASQQAASGQPACCSCCCRGQQESLRPIRWSWDWWFDSPITVFTGLLVVVGLFQVIFLGLAFRESRDASRTAEKAADAADRSAHALMAAERAYVAVKAFTPIPLTDANGIQIGQQCLVVWENGGTTPTKDLKTWVSWQVGDAPLPDNFDFPDLGGITGEGSQSFLGPKAQMDTIAFTIGAQDAVRLKNKERYLYIWGWAEYRDIFPNSPIRRTEFCNEVVGTAVPGNPNAAIIEFRHYKTHNSAT